MQEKDHDKFSFINEKIKDKPLNKRRLLIHFTYIAGVAVVFGLVASMVFAFFQPKFSQMMYPEQEPVVTIPKDEVEESEMTESTETESTEQEVTELIEPVVEELDIDAFQKLQNELYAVGREANKFVVTVTGVKSDTDWFNNAYESRGQASGIIIAENSKELLILSERKVISGAEEVYVTFINDVTVEATMKKYDGNTGIAVLSVPRQSVDTDTMSSIAIAELGNSYVTPQGMIVIAVGSPLGTNYSILTGNITSTTNTISTIDANYTVFTTDIVGSSDGSGVLINADGQVIGLVMQDYSSEGDRNTLTAISISELKTLIEMLSNNKDIPYVGLDITTVTNEIAKEYDIPKGAYVKDVKMDSPAMLGGIQKGDVIVRMDGEQVYTVDGYESKLLNLTPGERVKLVVERQSGSGYKQVNCTVDVSTLQ